MTVFARTYQQALDRMDRGLREFRIRGVKTNIPFLMNVVHHEEFKAGQATTRFIDNNPDLLKFVARKDRASKLLNYLADTIVNGNPHAKGHQITKAFSAPPIPQFDHRVEPARGTKQLLEEMGPEKFCKDWIAKQKRLLLTDTTMRDAHQSLLATRMRTFDMLAVADSVARRTPNLFSLEMWGGATFDVSMRFLREDPWDRLRSIRAKVPNILLQMLFRGSNAVGYTNYPDNVVKGFIKHAAENGMDIFRIFDSLNYLPNLKAAMDAVREDTTSICEGTLCYTGDILDPKRDKYDLKYYVRLAKELEKMGAHMLCIKDMAGLVRPFAAKKLVKALKDEVGIPIHFHTHDTSGLNASSIIEASMAGVDVVDAAIASMSGGTSQPNLNSIVAAMQNTPRDTQLDVEALQEFSDYWAAVRAFYKPFDTSEPYGTAEVYLHEMPGGQYTNLKEQATGMGMAARWPEIAHAYAEVNQLCGDIVKVTPSSKVVGDLAIECVARGVKPTDIVNLQGTKWSKDVTSMFEGWLGEPFYGMETDKAADSRKKWNKLADAIVGKGGKRIKGRPGTHAARINLDEVRTELETKLKRKLTEDDVWSYLMYPDVFLKFADFRKTYGDVAALPTPAYYYGLQDKEEIHISLEEGKTLFVRLLNMTEADANGQQTAIFELNGYPRHTTVTNKLLSKNAVTKVKADPGDPTQVGAPMPGMVASIAVSVGQKVKEGETLLTLEAMKMFAAVASPIAGTVSEISVKVGESVESKDLLMRLVK
jgi:pyruvate carboxylase